MGGGLLQVLALGAAALLLAGWLMPPKSADQASEEQCAWGYGTLLGFG